MGGGRIFERLQYIVKKLLTVYWVTEAFSIRQVYTFAVLFFVHGQLSYYTIKVSITIMSTITEATGNLRII